MALAAVALAVAVVLSIPGIRAGKEENREREAERGGPGTA